MFLLLCVALLSTLSNADAIQEVITNLGAGNGNDLGESSKTIFSQLTMVIEQAQAKTINEIEIFRLQTEKEKKQIRENATLSVEKCLNSAGKESERVESVHRSEKKELNREIQQIHQRLQEVNAVLETSRNALKTEKRTNAEKMKNIEKTLQQTKAGKAEIEAEKASVEKILQTTKAKVEAEKTEQRTVNSELRREAQSAEAKLKKTAEELHDARAENQGLEEDIKEFNKKLHEKNIANNQLVEKNQGHEKMTANLKAKLKDMQVEHGALQEQKNKLDENLKKSEEFGKGKIVENSKLRKEVLDGETKNKKLMKALEEKIEEMHGLEGSVKELKEINEKFEADFLDHMLSYLYVAAAFILVIVYIERAANTPIKKSKSGKVAMPETGSQAGPGKGRKAKARRKRSGSAINAVETINEKFVNQPPFTFVKGPLLLTIMSSCVLGFTSFMSSGFMQHNYAWEIIVSLNACALAGEYFQVNASVIVSLHACAIVTLVCVCYPIQSPFVCGLLQK